DLGPGSPTRTGALHSRGAEHGLLENYAGPRPALARLWKYKLTLPRDLLDTAYRFVRHRLNGVTYSIKRAASSRARRNKTIPV
ncbi:hypothetical protein, partial [Desulfallas sp. Bu1-1]|uniref:hypothetical protein n=1 Tax=Desulfallas sp. Bu1-1 TaxID=2787620 RepID=UPI001A9AAC8E